MIKSNRLKKNEDFNEIIKEGKKVMNKLFIIYYLPSLSDKIDTYRFGISVGKKYGNAPIRNRQKRIVRTIITNIDINIVKYDYVVISRPKCIGTDFQMQTNAMLQLLREIY